MTAPANFTQSLSPFQRRLIASALALVAAVVICLVLFGVFLLLRAFVDTFSGVLWPLAVAGILAMMLRPLVGWFERRLRLGRLKAIILLYVLVLLALAGLLALLLPLLFEQALTFIQKFPTIWENLRAALATTFPQVQEFLATRLGEERLARYEDALNQQLEKLLGFLAPAAQDFLSKLGGFLALATGMAIIPVYLFFFLRTERDPTADLKEQLSFLDDEWREDLVFLVREFAGSMEAFFRGQLLIGLIMGALLALGFSLGGVNFGIGLGLLIGALNVIPYLGTIIGLATVLPIAYFQPDGGLTLMGIALGVFLLVQMLEGYVLTPRIMGKQTGLHPLTIIIAIFFWGVALNGLLGMILAIPLTAFFVVAWRLAKRKYLSRLTAA
jgi:predicted PurR-regulated permease PerM